MTIEDLIPPEGITGLIALILMGGFWLSSTIAILCVMEVGRNSSLIGGIISANRESFMCRVYPPSYMRSGCTGWRETASIITPVDM